LFVLKQNWLIFIAILPCFLYAQSNEGTDFWFGFMQHRDNLTNTKVAMITAKQLTTGMISIPERGWNQAFTVPASGVVVVELPSYTETTGSEFVEDNAIHITSLEPVSVYIHQYFRFRSEAAVVLPTESLGKEYFTLMYTGFENFTGTYPPEFLVVSTEDNTLVTMQVTANTQNGRSAGSTFTTSLNKGEVYQVRAAEWNGDLSGSYIEADKRIAVFAGTSWSQVPIGCDTRDNLLEQMYPVQSLGTKFVAVPNAHLSKDQYRILATVDNTTVIVQSTGNIVYNLNRGEFAEFSLSESALIESSEPVMVAQYLVGQECNGYNLGDPSMVMLNSVEQVRDTVTLFNSQFENISQNYINIICRTQDIDNVYFDGVNLVSDGFVFSSVGSEEDYSYINLTVANGAHTIISTGCGVIATAYGYGELESYAYAGGANFSSINRNPIPEGGCLNDTVVFDAKLDSSRYSFIWDLGDEVRTEYSFTKFYDSLGLYPTSVIIIDHCLNEIDTFNRDMIISLRQAVDVLDFSRVCAGESYELSATDLPGASYEWTGPLDYFSEDQFPVLKNTNPEMSGKYSVIGIISGCATYPAITEVEIVPIPEPNLGRDSVICTRDEFDLILDPGLYSTYAWQDNSNSSTYFITSEGQYSVEVTDQYGCVGQDSVLLIEQCPTKIFMPNIFTPNRDQTNDLFGVLGTDIISMHLVVYDRWGNLMFESKDEFIQWDGTRNGVDADTGVYIWRLSFEGYTEGGGTYSEVQTGNVTLVR
jgi:gliding motility-associated-like protein